MNPSDEQLIRAIDQAPSVIQDSLSGGSAVEFMSAMPGRYGLHLDTAGYVSEFIRNMLLGFLRPEQFVEKLSSVGITGDVARNITTDLNKEIFIPLRDAMRKSGAPAHPSSIPHVPVMNVGKTAQITPPATPKPIEVPPYNLIREEAPVVPAIPITAPPPVTAPTPAPTMRTMQHDMAMLEQGHMPDPYPIERPAKMSPLPHPSQMTPAREFQTASVPFTSQHTLQQPIPVPAQAIVRAPLPPAPKPPAQPVVQATKQSGDPYRESI